MGKEELSSKQERNRNFVAETIAEKFYSVKMSEETKEKILEIKNILNENPNLSYVILFNHTYYGDPLFAGYIANKLDSNLDRQIIAPVSAFHISTEGNKSLKLKDKIENYFARGLNKIAKSTGVETIPIVQANDKRFTEKETVKNRREFITRLRELSGQKIGCLISPEGHRSEDGKLQEGNPGIQLITDKLKPVIVIPVGIYFEAKKKGGIFVRKYKRSGLNFGKKVNINIGEYRILGKEDKMKTEEMMDLLANTLPLDLRGEEYLNDEQKKELAQMPEVRTIVKMSKNRKAA